MLRSRQARSAACVLTLGALASLAAGCAGSASPSVASLGTAAKPSTSSSSSGGAGPTLKIAGAAAFSSCMRSHGVPNFPDPSSSGALSIGPGSGIDPNSSTFRAAQQACQKVLPNGGRPSPQQLAKMQQHLLAFSACMRSHGVPDFPDPTFTGGGAQLKLRASSGSDLDPQSPRFQAAQTACQGNLPGNVKVAGRPTTGGK